MKQIRFLSTGSYIPQRQVTNAEIVSRVNTTDKWIQEHTGIKTRYISASTEAASDLGCQAANTAIQKANLDKQEIQMIIVATSTPDYLGFPATACIVQQKLNISHCFAYDISAACSGFTFACSSAVDAIYSGLVENALIIGTEVFSSIVNWDDRSTCILFGDGAGAAILSSKFSGSSRILSRHLISNPSAYSSLIIRTGGSAERNAAHNSKKPYIEMNGRLVYQFATNMLLDTTRTLLQKSSLALDDIDYIIPHQANQKMLLNYAKKIGIPAKKMIINIDKYGNTSAASIPIALNEGIDTGKIQRGMKLLLIGFGAGITCGGIILEW